MSDGRPNRLMLLSVLAAVTTIALKTTAYAFTGSVGLLSDALESGVNLLAAITGLLSVWYSARPVDETHTYGHEKIEFFASGLEGVLIALAALGIGWYAVNRIIFPEPLSQLDVGFVLSLIAGLVNLGVGQILLRVGVTRHNIVLEADGRHLMTDVWTTFAVLVGIGLVRITGLLLFDPLCGLGMAFFIVWTGADLIRRSFHGLMDHSLSESEQMRVRDVIKQQIRPGMDFHALRTRMAGSHRFADFHLLVPGTLSVQEAHAVADSIEQAIEAELPRMEVTVHIEPIEEKAAWTDSALVPLEMASRKAEEKAGQP